MVSLIRDYTEKISGKKAFWMPLLFYTFGGYGFSMLNRTVGVDDLATPLYVDDTVWFAELRWGAVLWKKLFSFGANVPFLDKFVSVCFLMLAGTVLGCLFYALNGRRQQVWLYTIAACSFITYPIISEIWEFTCGGTLIVPGDFFCTFALLLFLLCGLPGVTQDRTRIPVSAADGADSPAERARSAYIIAPAKNRTAPPFFRGFSAPERHPPEDPHCRRSPDTAYFQRGIHRAGLCLRRAHPSVLSLLCAASVSGGQDRLVPGGRLLCASPDHRLCPSVWSSDTASWPSCI